jgi:hypothetical protein
MRNTHKKRQSGWYAALIILLLALGACGETPSLGEEDAEEEELLKEGWVKVQVALPQDGARSLNTFQAQKRVDYYEIVFQDVVSLVDHYSGSAHQGEKFLNLALPGGKNYNIQLLAGSTQSNGRVLLASAYVANYAIAAGQTNVVELTLEPIQITFGTTGYSFTLDTDDMPPARKDQIAQVNDGATSTVAGKLAGITTPGTKKLTVKVTPVLSLTSGANLENADVKPTGKARGMLGVYADKKKAFNSYLGQEVTVAGSGDYSFEFLISDIQAATPVNGDWVFDFEIDYYAFNKYGWSSKWTIRNGLTSDIDEVGGDGGGIWIKFGSGNGFSPSNIGDVTVYL